MLSDGLHGHVTCQTMHGRYLSSWTAHHVCWGEVFARGLRLMRWYLSSLAWWEKQ